MSTYGTLTIGGVRSADYNIYVLDVNDADIPERDYTAYSVPGRSRDIHYDNGRFFNIDRIYKCVVFAEPGVTATEKITGFIARLMRLKGYQRIESSLHPDYFKLGEFRGGIQPEFAKMKTGAMVDLTFDCDARKYLLSGETQTTITNTGSSTWQSKTLVNPGTLPAKPLLEFSSFTSSNCGIVKGSYQLTINQYSGTLIYDMELGDAYDKTSKANLNSYVTERNSFELSPGSNTFSVKSGATVKITPRWNSL